MPRTYTHRRLFRGEIRTTAEIAELTGMRHETVRRWIALGKDLEAAARSVPRLYHVRGRKLPLREAAAVIGVDTSTLLARHRRGDPLEGNREDTPWECDAAAQRFVAEHPGGATLDEVGEFFGISRERVRQIEVQALRKLARYSHALESMPQHGVHPLSGGH